MKPTLTTNLTTEELQLLARKHSFSTKQPKASDIKLFVTLFGLACFWAFLLLCLNTFN